MVIIDPSPDHIGLWMTKEVREEDDFSFFYLWFKCPEKDFSIDKFGLAKIAERKNLGNVLSFKKIYDKSAREPAIKTGRILYVGEAMDEHLSRYEGNWEEEGNPNNSGEFTFIKTNDEFTRLNSQILGEKLLRCDAVALWNKIIDRRNQHPYLSLDKIPYHF